jgi:integrase
MKKDSKYPRRPARHEMRRITIEQIKHLLEATQEHALKALLTVAITTGLRRGELLGLHWQDIDVQNEILHVRRMVSPIGGRESTETARTIALSTRAVDALKEHQHHQNEARTKAGETWHNLDLVFPNEVGQPFDPAKLRQLYHLFFVAVGLPQMRFHDLRRCTIVFFVLTGANPIVIQAMLGLRSRSTSVQTLGPVSLAMQKEAMQTWDTLFGDMSFEAPSRIIQDILLHKPETEEE